MDPVSSQAPRSTAGLCPGDTAYHLRKAPAQPCARSSVRTVPGGATVTKQALDRMGTTPYLAEGTGNMRHLGRFVKPYRAVAGCVLEGY